MVLMRFDDVMLIEMMCSVLVTSVITVDWFDSMLLHFQQKAELNLQLSIALQLHAARPAGSLPFLCSISTHA